MVRFEIELSIQPKDKPFHVTNLISVKAHSDTFAEARAKVQTLIAPYMSGGKYEIFSVYSFTEYFNSENGCSVAQKFFDLSAEEFESL